MSDCDQPLDKVTDGGWLWLLGAIVVACAVGLLLAASLLGGTIEHLSDIILGRY